MRSNFFYISSFFNFLYAISFPWRRRVVGTESWGISLKVEFFFLISFYQMNWLHSLFSYVFIGRFFFGGNQCFETEQKYLFHFKKYLWSASSFHTVCNLKLLFFVIPMPTAKPRRQAGSKECTGGSMGHVTLLQSWMPWSQLVLLWLPETTSSAWQTSAKNLLVGLLSGYTTVVSVIW